MNTTLWLVLLCLLSALCLAQPNPARQPVQSQPRALVMTKDRVTVLYPNGNASPLNQELKLQHGQRLLFSGQIAPSASTAPVDYPPLPKRATR